jgi:hypothetical protein
MRFTTSLVSLCVTFASVSNADASLEDICIMGYKLCSPSGATTTVTPKIGDASMAYLFSDIVDSSLPSGNSKRSPGSNLVSPRDEASLCCVSSLACMTMSGLLIPFCYDRFTTNFFLPDGSYGNVVSGAYTSSSRDTANLLSGAYTLANGSTGNIYAANPAAKPNTATLSLPAPFTGSGVGSAIPASALGVEVTLTYTTVLPGITIAGTTIPATTIPAHTQSVSTVTGTTLRLSVSGSTFYTTVLPSVVTESLVPPSTIAAITVAGTTVAAITTVITTTTAMEGGPATTTSPASSPASTSTNIVGFSKVPVGGMALGVAIAVWRL